MGKTKSRGRRAEKKNKKNEPGFNEDVSNLDSDVTITNQEPLSSSMSSTSGIPNTFFGLVDNNELDYFKQAESTLNINAFETDEERQGFINSVLEEAQGKELKLVTNQICSKLMERLILFANHNQLKKIFKQFQNHFVSLAFHKYASHVLETLLVRSAALIEKELTQTDEEKLEEAVEEEKKKKQKKKKQKKTVLIMTYQWRTYL